MTATPASQLESRLAAQLEPGRPEPGPPGAALACRRPRARRALDALFAAIIAGALLLSAFHLLQLARLALAENALALLSGGLLGMLAADAVTGLVHWAFDTWGSPRTRWLGPTLIRPFREHHDDPLAMCRHDWIEVNREPMAAAFAAFALLGVAPVLSFATQRPFFYAFVWALLSFGATVNQIHLWAHAQRPPRLVGWLQRAGLVLGPARHARHHRPPHAQAYCISTGWLNAPLDAIGFWRALERLVRSAARSRGPASRTPFGS